VYDKNSSCSKMFDNKISMSKETLPQKLFVILYVEQELHQHCTSDKLKSTI
jgi:hypothetical protein